MSDSYMIQFKRQQFKLNESFRRCGISPMPANLKLDDVPDIPPCDGCGQNYRGVHACAGCQLAYYCSRNCQRAAWKKEHRLECRHMGVKAKETAEEVVGKMVDTCLPCNERADPDNLDRLGNSAYYKAALACDINTAIQKLMKEETENFSVGNFLFITEDTSYVFNVMNVILLGGACQRQKSKLSNGEEVTVRDTVDGYRCKSYIMSSPDAFEDMFRASMETIALCVHRDVKDEKHRAKARRHALEMMKTWMMMFANKKVSKAIILGQSRTTDEGSVRRVKWIAKQIKCVLTKLWNAPTEDREEAEQHLYVLCGCMMLRLKEYKVPLDLVKLLGLRGKGKRFLFLNMPLLDHMIRKGKMLTVEETSIVNEGRRIEY